MRKVALAACSILVLVASLTAAEAQPRYGYPGGYAYPPYAYGPAYGYGPYYPRRVYSAPVYGPPPYCGPGPVVRSTRIAAPHEIPRRLPNRVCAWTRPHHPWRSALLGECLLPRSAVEADDTDASELDVELEGRPRRCSRRTVRDMTLR